MRPVTISPQNVPDAINELMTASHENDIVELAQAFTVANTPATAQRSFIGSSIQTGSAGNGADTTEDTLFTFTLPASSLASTNEGITVLAFGTLANNADNKTVRLYFGSQNFSLGTVATANVAWSAKFTVFKTGSNAQVIFAEGQIGATLIAPAVITGTQTDTAGIVIKVTGQAGTANANDIVANALIVNGALSDLTNSFATWIADRQRGGVNRTN